MTKVWDYCLDNHTQKLVLLALADNANDDGFCWPSMRTVATKCNLTEAGTRKTMKALVVLGLLTIESGGGHSTNRYTINIEALNRAEIGHPLTPLPPNAVTPRGKPCYPQGATPLPPGVNPVTPNHNRTIIEPSENHQEILPKPKEESSKPVLELTSDIPKASPSHKPSQPPRDEAWCEWLREFKAQWGAVYTEALGVRSTFLGGREIKAVKELYNDKRTVAEVIKVAKLAFGHRHDKQSHFHCSLCLTVDGLVRHFNAVQAELNGELMEDSEPVDDGMDERTRFYVKVLGRKREEVYQPT